MKIFTHYVVENGGWYMVDTGFGYDFEPDLQFARLFNSKEAANRALATIGKDDGMEFAEIKEWVTVEKDLQ